MRITSKGQVTIPIHIREQAGLLPQTDVLFQIDGDGVRLFPAPHGAVPSRGQVLADRLVGRGDVRITTDEIMAMTRGEP
jgi:bifunctional DNA-binding transcriptional regulator/antitoxin component of YhaV-PrlF toxin-antitoxin module